MRWAFRRREGGCWLDISTNFLSAFMVCLNSSENLICSWSCQVSPSAEKRACKDTILSFRSVLNRFSSSAKRRTCSGSMIAWAIVFLFVCVCGSPRRRVLTPVAPDLPKPALFPPSGQILTTVANHLDSAPGPDTLVAYVRRAKSHSRYPQRGENATDI